MTHFIPGLKLAELFFQEAVHPLLASRFSDLRYSAGRLGTGSDVLGFDTPQSMDHHWGPRVTLFLDEQDFQRHHDDIMDVMATDLPYEIHGFPTHFTDPNIDGGKLQRIDTGLIEHGVEVTTPPSFFGDYIGWDPTSDLSETDWLAFPPQHLRTIASGRVFKDGLGQLERIRARLHWYPHDVWLYLMANQWRRIDQEEPFMARCGDVGDGLGSRIVAMRQVNELMRLCFLIERQYAPYYKWFGTAFAQLDCAATLTPIFHAIFDAPDWKTREQHLSAAYREVIPMHNDLAITPPSEASVSHFYDRPYLVPHASRMVVALHDTVKSPAIRQLPQHTGSIAQFVDSTDVLSSAEDMRKLVGIYEIVG